MVVTFSLDAPETDHEVRTIAHRKWMKLVALLQAYRFFQESFTQMSMACKSIPNAIREELKIIHGTSRRARSLRK